MASAHRGHHVSEQLLKRDILIRLSSLITDFRSNLSPGGVNITGLSKQNHQGCVQGQYEDTGMNQNVVPLWVAEKGVKATG